MKEDKPFPAVQFRIGDYVRSTQEHGYAFFDISVGSTGRIAEITSGGGCMIIWDNDPRQKRRYRSHSDVELVCRPGLDVILDLLP